MTDSNHHSASAEGVDPVMGFWRDVWARSAAAAGMPGGGGASMPGFGQPQGAAGAGGMPPGAEAFGAAFTPEAVRRMQAAFLEAMAQYAEQWMKSPQFLDSLKRTMDRALEFRRQMDDFLQTNMASAFEAATGGANSEVMGAIRQSTAQLQEQMARITERLDELEARGAGKSTRRGTTSGESVARPGSRRVNARSTAGGSTTTGSSRRARRR